MNTLTIAIPAQFLFVPGVRSCISCICSYFGFDEHEEYQIQTIIDELCNNAIEHGSKSPDSIIEINAKMMDQQLEVSVCDTGNKPFNKEETLAFVKERMERGWEAEEMVGRGRGLFIVQKLVDVMDITTNEQGTKVSIIKRHATAPELQLQ